MMKSLIAASVLAVITGCATAGQAATSGAEQAEYTASDKAEKLAKQYLLIDTHIDVPYRIHDKWEDVTEATAKGDFDYPRAVEG
ncbi:hypothetical protein OS103_24160, partial [Escherichia coli]|uniref:hypothetical protein n=1 Tax=Escherichia coli TaxID=562 RepID=UPI002393FF9A|nr:hypothetical protein [Escherichia coli]